MHIEEKIRFWQERIVKTKLHQRTMPDEWLLALPKIISFLWWRRVGKSSMMISLLQTYIQKKEITIDQIIFLDFSELDNHNIDLTQIYTLYKDKEPFFVLDEIQELKNFEQQLIFLYNQWCRLFISWSNAQLLSQEIATKLRGRVIEIPVNVLSFKEYLWFKQIPLSSPAVEMDIHFENYMMRWWYPEVVLSDSLVAKKSILQSYVEILIYKDIIDRYAIKNQEILIRLIKSLVISHTKPVNVNKLFNTYKSLWYSLSKNTLYEYIQYIKNTFFVTSLWKFYTKSYSDKVYLIDNGYMNIFSDKKNFWQKFEHICYQYLLKKETQLWYISESTYEVDFTNWTTNRQASYLIHEDNFTREFAFWKKQKEKENILITMHPTPYSQAWIQCVTYKDILLD